MGVTKTTGIDEIIGKAASLLTKGGKSNWKSRKIEEEFYMIF